MSGKECIANNDFETAYEKFKNANKRWAAHWFEVCQTILNNCKELAKKYILDPINQTISGVKTLLDGSVVWSCEEIDYPKGSELLYLIRMLDNNDNIVYSKVGTTTRKVKERMREHLRYYLKEGVRKIIIDRVWNCDTNAECYESLFRGHYIKKYPNTFKKNDRFKGVLFDLEEADNYYKLCCEM